MLSSRLVARYMLILSHFLEYDLINFAVKFQVELVLNPTRLIFIFLRLWRQCLDSLLVSKVVNLIFIQIEPRVEQVLLDDSSTLADVFQSLQFFLVLGIHSAHSTPSDLRILLKLFFSVFLVFLASFVLAF